MRAMRVLSLFVLCLGVALAEYGYDEPESDLYDDLREDMLLQELQKRLSMLEDSYFDEDNYGPADRSDYIPLDSRDSGQMENRDREYLEHSSNSDGFQYISGGAGEGKQHLTPEGLQDNVQEVKSDEALPFYCHPPNPCPKGYTSEDGCVEPTVVPDSAEAQKYWIEEMQVKEMCRCDEEHMFACPKGKGEFNAKVGGNSKDSLDAVINDVFKSDKEDGPWLQGNKRAYIVSKKSPRIKREAAVNYHAIDEELAKMQKRMQDGNPYLSGAKISTYAKKMSISP